MAMGPKRIIKSEEEEIYAVQATRARIDYEESNVVVVDLVDDDDSSSDEEEE